MSDTDIGEHGGSEVSDTNATYDGTTVRGRTRFWLSDTDMDCPTFSDDDIDGFLFEAGYTGDTTVKWRDTPSARIPIFLAASLGYEQRANAAAPFAKKTKTGVFATDTQTKFEDFQERADHFRELALMETPAEVGCHPCPRPW